ncbi:hypothetical protein MJ004_12875 [Acinetobacter junii]|uniref:hypothetical protein n=1 Tax=Acinetobacter junii TaxID=40215 RepID=UPI0022EAE95A|nr:hypothetical protein [Acinetobacter junii]MDA3509284.1 hypothetical protein [Acinetobacter junii]MDA3533583.1 hypothetical protein [Acinetobacter junii]
MRLDREWQNIILQHAAESYPEDLDLEALPSSIDVSDIKFYANLQYLEDHKLIEPDSYGISLDNIYFVEFIKITAKGLDFLANDGGLSAILNVVTVKFEADTLKAILEKRINQADLAPADKKSMIDALRELPSESIKHLTMKLLDEGLENLPSAILLIGTYLGMS